ncbi:MAG: ERAP1-like C-terminal domain-containing protein, partial [Thermoplasmata archaeon]
SSKPIKKVMEYWIKNKGYPVVEVDRKNGSVELKQRTFMLNGKKESGKWPIPLTIVTQNGVKSELMEKDLKTEPFIKLNADNSGFYRVLYDDETFADMMSNYRKLSNLDKWGLLNDLYAFLLSGDIDIKTYREKISKFMDDTDHLVVEELSSQVYTLYLIKPESSSIKKDAVDYIRKHLNRLGSRVKNEDDKISMLRGILASYLAGMDDNYAKDLSSKFSSLNEDPDLVSAIAVAVARTNGMKALVDAIGKYTDDEITVRLVAAMGWTKPSEIEQVFSLIDNNTIKKQDMLAVFRTMPVNPSGRDTFFKNIDKIVSLMEHAFEGTGYTARILEGSLPLIALTKYDDAKAKAKQLKKPDTEMGINKAL